MPWATLRRLVSHAAITALGAVFASSSLPAQKNRTSTIFHSTVLSAPLSMTMSGNMVSPSVDVFVSIMGGASAYGHQLYYFANGYDRRLADGGGVAIGPGKPRPTLKWLADQNEIRLGTFRPGTELLFGLLVNGQTWYFSGSPGRNADGLTHVLRFGQQSVLGDDSRTTLIGGSTGRELWGFEDLNGPYGGRSDRDFNDFVFSTRSAVATPEPSTLALFAPALLGLGAVLHRRRRKA